MSDKYKIIRLPVEKFNYYIRRGWIKWTKGPKDGFGCRTHCEWLGVTYTWSSEFPRVGGQIIVLNPIKEAK
jgi:hypothetical protein